MQLIFHDASHVSPALAAGEAMLTIERKGNFSLSIGAVAALKLLPKEQVVLAQDLKTNAWYLMLEALPGQKPFVLKPRDSKNDRALMFCGAQRARAYYEAHGLGEERSVRARVGLEPVQHEKLTLFPLVPQHATKTAAAAVAAEPASQPDVAPLASDLPFLQAQPTAAVPAQTTPMASAAAPADETTEERMERLTDYWYEHDIKGCEEAELAELQAHLADKPKKERDIIENTVLNTCKTETARRKKKGGDRG